MRISIIEDGRVVNIIEAESVERAALYYSGCRAWVEGDVIEPGPQDPDAALRAQYEAERAAAKEAEFAAYKSRSGAPSYKAAAVKIAAEKLGLLDAIDTAIMGLVDRASDKSLYVWWAETPTISRGDAQWIEIEAAVVWTDVTASELFTLASQI